MLTSSWHAKVQALEQSVTAKLQAYEDATKVFLETHASADILEVESSRLVDGKVVLVLNEVQLDEVQAALRRHREVEEKISELELTMVQLRKDLAEAKEHAARRAEEGGISDGDDEEEESSEPWSDAEEGDEETDHSRPKKRARSTRSSSSRQTKVKRPKVGKQDKKIQAAFKELLREGFGIEVDDPWPTFPTVARTHPDWPRHTVEAGAAEEEAMEGDDAEVLGAPQDRLDWVNGRLDDANFTAVLQRHARTILEEAEAYNIPEDQRDYDHIYRACSRTLTNLKRTCADKIKTDAEELRTKQHAKSAADRRRRRRKTRFEARQKAARENSQKFPEAVRGLIKLDCVEGDETEDDVPPEDEADSEADTEGKQLRAVIPEWWSAENQELQKRLEKSVPTTSSGYRVKAATHLRRHTDKLGKIPRLAVSETFAKTHPALVMRVQKNKGPFKPEAGAIAANADAWGAPITNLALPVGDDDAAGQEGGEEKKARTESDEENDDGGVGGQHGAGTADLEADDELALELDADFE
ncbi:hypothetical protein V8E36_009530 [Tilletia maclaganii]